MSNRSRSPKARAGPDRCPGAITLHEAQDGPLARVRLPGGRLPAAQLLAIAEAADRGNGLVDLTSRANVQIRGLRQVGAQELTASLLAAGLLRSVAHDRARNVIASPLAGRHRDAVADTDRILAALDAAVCASPELAALPGRFLFALDDGSGLALDPPADVTLRAASVESFVLDIGGSRAREPVRAQDAPRIARDAARAFLRARAAVGSRAWRIAELQDGPELVARRLGIELTRRQIGRERVGRDAATAPASVLRLGRLVQRDGRLAFTALAPLGRLDRGMLAGLAALVPEVRLSTRRTVTLTDVEPDRAGAVAGALEGMGMVLGEDSGWVGLTACAGLGRCPKARVDVRAAAARRAAVRVAAPPPEHWSACQRRCGQRAEQEIAVTATPGGPLVVEMGGRERAATIDSALEMLDGAGPR